MWLNGKYLTETEVAAYIDKLKHSKVYVVTCENLRTGQAYVVKVFSEEQKANDFVCEQAVHPSEYDWDYTAFEVEV